MESLDLLSSKTIRHIHFIGIGGVSMSGLAEILLDQGYEISGSDMKASASTKKLENMGVLIYPFHSRENIKNPDLVVYTAAIKDDNPELQEARKLGIPAIDRAQLLGQVMKKYPYSIAVSGTHGKTTTTSMVTMIMLEAELNPTVHIGGELEAIGGSTRIGGNRYFISEACEYYESFLKFNPFLGIILNIELDHVDYFKDLDHIKTTFLKFAGLIPQNGVLVTCADDLNVMDLVEKVGCNIVTYGIKNQYAMWSVKNIQFDDFGYASFTVLRKGEVLGQIKLNVPGIHNVSNALASIAACYSLGCSMQSIINGLKKFHGTQRRFQPKGEIDGIRVVDDYAHHPSEVQATLNAARNVNAKKIWCVFQPHTYTRTKHLLGEFAVSFSNADNVIITDIYAAREPDRGEIHASALAQKINEVDNKAIYIKDFNDIANYLMVHAKPGDLIITMGAGDVYRVGEIMLKKADVMAVS